MRTHLQDPKLRKSTHFILKNEDTSNKRVFLGLSGGILIREILIPQTLYYYNRIYRRIQYITVVHTCRCGGWLRQLKISEACQWQMPTFWIRATVGDC